MKPWYRQSWPWLLMAPPAAAVAAGIVTTVLAVTSFDGLVADDYYKQGLGINRTLARDERARAIGLDAAVQFNEERSRVRVVLGNAAHPASIRLVLVHPTKAGADQSVILRAGKDGVYEGTLQPLHAATVQVRIEDGEGRWRLAGTWSTRDDAVRLAP
jgi:hypothetical protein